MAVTVRVEYCRECGLPTSQVGELSRRGKCVACSTRNVEAAPEQMQNRTGPIGEKWLANLRRGVSEDATRSNTPS